MTTQDKLISRKLTLIELADFLKNVSQACKIHVVSRQHVRLILSHPKFYHHILISYA